MGKGSVHQGVSARSSLVEHLSRVEYSVRVEDAPEFAHHPHRGIPGELGQERLLGHADAVLAGDGAAETNGLCEYLFEGLLDAMHLIFVALVCQEGGVQIAVAHVAEGADAQLDRKS